MISESFLILGTDTGVGKTVVSLLCMQFLRREGNAPFYLKPFQTGCIDARDENSDARFIYRYMPGSHRQDPELSTLYCFKKPKAPYFAARDEGKGIDPNRLYGRVNELIHGNTYTHLIIEGAGGILVPVTADRLLAEVVKPLTAKIILVARAGLGTINHTLLSLEALERRGLPPQGVILVDKDPPGTPEDMIRENIEAVESFSASPVAGTVGRIDDFAAPDDTIYRVIKKALTPKIPHGQGDEVDSILLPGL